MGRRVLLRACLVLLGAGSYVRAQDTSATHRLTQRDGVLLGRYLPLLVRSAADARSEYEKTVAESDSMPAWREAIRAGTVDLAEQLKKLIGTIPLPPDVTLDVRCTAEMSDVLGGVRVTYLLQQRLPAVRPRREGLLAVAGADVQNFVGLAERNSQVTERWATFLMRNGYARVLVGVNEYAYVRVVKNDSLSILFYDNSECRYDTVKQFEPALTFLLPFRAVKEGKREKKVNMDAEYDRMLAHDSITTDYVASLVGAASLARLDAERGDLTDGMPDSLITPPMRNFFALRQANANWFRVYGERFRGLLIEYERVSR